MYHCLKLHSVTLPLLFHLALPSDQPASSITVPVVPTLHTPLVQRYIDYLKDRYINKSPLLKEKVLKVRPKEFIHLNLVSNVARDKEEEEEEVKSQCLLLQLRGDIAAIRKKRIPMEMEDVGISKNQSVAKHILVEGSPGIGKTMFSWELCRQWAEGKMLKDRDIVLMLQLRSKRVREANNLSDLFHHNNEETKQEVLKHITSVDGEGVFLVLEGYDELTENQRAEGSILNQLLIGECLPKASIMVTSRPLASDSLCPEFKERVDQHIEIVGFNDEDIKSYLESACRNVKQHQKILADLLSYVSSNPFVSSLMYIPLQCAILTALYIEKWQKRGSLYAPTTLTQLYTDLLLSSLIRYMRDDPIYSKYKMTAIRQLSGLPSEVQEQLSKLSELAAKGLENRQFIYDSIPCDHMGLMQSTEEELVIGSSVSYCFLHLTLQEYLAALHWSRMGPEDLVRLVSKTSLFPLDTLVKDGITEATHYHWPALYFLSGLTSIPTELLKGCLTAAVTELKDDWIKYILEEMPSLRPAFSATFGAEYNPYFFQLLFESQSRELVAELFTEDLCNPMSTNPLECLVTAWCVANSSPKSRWLVRFGDVLALEKFVENFKRFRTESRQGTIAGVFVRDCKFQAARWKALPSLPSIFPQVEYLGIRDILVADVTHFVPLFSIVREFASLKVLEIWIEDDDGVLPEVTIPPQHCPSLFTLTISGKASSFLLQCFALANINTLTTLECPLPTDSSNLSSLCTCLSQTTSLEVLIITDTDVTTREAKELASALEKNRSLEVLGFRAYSVTITDEADRILEEVSISRPSTLRKFFLEPNHVPVDVDPKLALAESQAMAAVERQTGIEENKELQQALPLIEQ